MGVRNQPVMGQLTMAPFVTGGHITTRLLGREPGQPTSRSLRHLGETLRGGVGRRRSGADER